MARLRSRQGQSENEYHADDTAVVPVKVLREFT